MQSLLRDINPSTDAEIIDISNTELKKV